MSWLLVGVGGSIGAVLRYLVGKWAETRNHSAFPIATFTVNTTGSFILGLVTRLAGILYPHWSVPITLFLGTGFCGAYTTFSTFSYEAITLVRHHRRAQAVLYVLGSLSVGLASGALGLYGLPIH